MNNIENKIRMANTKTQLYGCYKAIMADEYISKADKKKVQTAVFRACNCAEDYNHAQLLTYEAQEIMIGVYA